MTRFHNLRHTYASLLIDQGENMKYIQKQLGHSKPTVTLDIYAHLMDENNPEAADRLKQMISVAELGPSMVLTCFQASQPQRCLFYHSADNIHS